MMWLGLALAQPAWEAQVQPREEEAPPLTFLGVVQARGSATNIAHANPFFNGQVVGVLDGPNGTLAADGQRSAVAEQRALGFLTYRPVALDDRAGLTAGFEIDFAWGDSAYGTGGNAGGGFGGDQVNLQTRRLHADFDAGSTHTIVGLQFVGDGVSDPTRTTLDGLVRSGGRLMVFGSEAGGIQSFGQHDIWSWRLGAFTLVEGDLSVNDDVGLLMVDGAVSPSPQLSVGVHAWHLRDRANSTVGPTSFLAPLQGAASWTFDTPTNADLTWVGLDAGFNPGLSMGRVGVHGVALANLGRFYIEERPDLDLASVLVDVEGRARWAAGDGSVVRAEVLYTSPGFVTGNAYGIVGAAWTTHGCLLLHPDSFAINRMVSQVGDVSGGDDGLVSLTGTLAWDAVPNKVNLAVGGGHAIIGQQSAQEGNLRLTVTPLPLVDVGLTGAYLARQGEDAWMGLATLQWLVI